MVEALKQRILSINPLKPYVWRLRLTEKEYHQLEDFVRTIPSIIQREYAILAIVYIAEWYKRAYEGTVSNPLEGVAAESLWKASGFASDLYVYHTSKTSRYLESIYMLGGLPMSFILGRRDRTILKALCRLYKGEKSSLEGEPSLGKGQAFAFQESIYQQGSIYAFMKALLLDDSKAVYAEEDLENKSSLANQFIAAVQTAYEEVMRDKFRIEWIVEYNPASPYLRRMLRLHLRPEEIGGLHQYLRFERARTWKIPQLMRQRSLRVSIRFRNGKEVLSSNLHPQTLITFENTGQEETGFEATGNAPWGLLRSIPVEPFDGIDVVVTDEQEKQYVVQHIPCKDEYIQLWAMPNEVNRWSSLRSNQNETAVVFSRQYTLEEADYETKPFYDKNYGLSLPWHFAFITDHLTLKSDKHPDVTLWNRNGYVLFAPRLYSHLLQYKAGKVRYLYNEDPEVYAEPETEEWYAALFCKEDINVYHFQTREAIETQPDKAHVQKIEFKPFDASPNESYQEWTEECIPPYGRIKLRLTIKDEEKIYPVLFLPSLLQQGYREPILRDYEQEQLVYVDAHGSIVAEKIQILEDKQPLDPTHALIPWGNEMEMVILDAIQPTLMKEVYLDGRISKYLHEGDKMVLPYLLRNRIEIHDFNREGYFEFRCFNVGEIKERGSIDKWLCGDTLRTHKLSHEIPSYLNVQFGNKKSEGKIDQLLYWEYKEEDPPKVVDASFIQQMSNYSILFQDMKEVRDDLLCLPPVTKNDPTVGGFDFGDWEAFMNPTPSKDKKEKEENKALLCFDTAVKYKTYFFIFNPLFNLTEKEFVTDICHEIRQRNGGELREEDLTHIIQCATELGLDWEKMKESI